MSKNTTYLVAALGVLGVLIAAPVGLYLISKAQGPTKAQTDAVTLIETPAVYPGKDGFAALYSLAYDIPQHQARLVLEEDVRGFTTFAAEMADQPNTKPLWYSHLNDYPSLLDPHTPSDAWCGSQKGSCLDQVRADLKRHVELVEQNAQLLDRTAALGRYDHFRYPFPAHHAMPIPAYQALGWLTTRHAVRFAQGNVDAALAGVCEDVTLGQRLTDTSDLLIGSMVGASLTRRSATLFTEMLAELTTSHPLPSQCITAFAPKPRSHRGVCQAMLGEGRLSLSAYRDASAYKLAREENFLAPLLFDPQRTAERVAPHFSQYCSAGTQRQIERDLPVVDTTPEPSFVDLGCVSNPVGCVLSDIAEPAYSNYARRMQDADAIARATASLMALRAQEGPLTQAAVAELPVEMNSPGRPITLEASQQRIGIQLYQPADEKEAVWHAPLPGSRFLVKRQR